MESRIEVDGKIEAIDPMAPVAGYDYEPGDDGTIEPLPPTAQEIVKHAPKSEFAGYVGLLRQDN
jgi:hypothetical protein